MTRLLSPAALAVILLFAAWTRLAWPPMPLADPDAWGYLHPALAKLTGHGFQHTAGRNFLYPGFLCLLLSAWGDFRVIPLAQHALGIASGGLLWVCWRQWRAWFAPSRLPAWVDALAGLGLVAFFEQSASVVGYEHQIRPEAVFPFFALLDLCLLLAFLRAWFVERRPVWASALAGGGLFVALFLYQLKPSFGLATGVAALPVLLAILTPNRPRRLLATLAILAILAAFLLFILPEKHLSRDDPMRTLFLPETLLTVHANLLLSQMDEDMRDGVSIPWPAGTREALASELNVAAQPAHHPYPTLGFNPDHLMYGSQSFCAWLTARLSPPQVAALAYHYYLRTWTHHPWRMAAKVGRQLGVFYSLHCPAFWPGRTFDLDKLYRNTLKAFDYPNYQAALSPYPPAREYLAAAGRLARAGRTLPQPALMTAANTAASVGALPLLLLFGASMAWAGWLGAPADARLLAPGGVLLLLYGLIFGNCLTIAVIHSLDVDRYSINLLVFCAPALVGTLVWLAELALACRDRPAHQSQIPT